MVLSEKTGVEGQQKFVQLKQTLLLKGLILQTCIAVRIVCSGSLDGGVVFIKFISLVQTWAQ